MNLKNILNQSVSDLRQAEVSTPELDAQVLLCHVLNKDKAFLLTYPETELKPWQIIKFKKLVNRRKKFEPIAYITGHKEFFGNDFLVNKNTLIPRPETEFLVEEALHRIKYLESNIKDPNNPRISNTKYQILDVGTGTGCIIISLVREIKKLFNYSTIEQFNFFAVDISKKTLAVAKKNAKELLPKNVIASPFDCAQGMSEIECHSEPTAGWIEEGEKSHNNKVQPVIFLHSDLLQNKELPQKFDLIIANLPYVTKIAKSEKRKTKSGIDFEPKDAIFCEDNGTAIIKRFLLESKNRMNKNGLILIELGPQNAIELERYIKKLYPEAKIDLKKDLAQRDRYLKIYL